MVKISDHTGAFQRIYAIVRCIPKGKVMTYKQVSLLANVATPRVVGFALHVNKDPRTIPCHRVIFSNGTLTKGYAFGGEYEQRKRLESEGIIFTQDGKVDLQKYLLQDVRC